ncbi:MAG: MFS transporter [Dermatophilaceae bacterium]
MTPAGRAEAVEEAPFRLRSVAVAAYGPTIFEGLGYGAAIPVVPLLARQLGASVGGAAFVVGLLGIGQLVTSLPAGSLIGTYGERRAMIVASGAGALAAAVAGWAPTVGVLAAATLLTGMTWSVFLLARQGFMIDAVPPDMRARALSTLGGSHRVGSFVGPLLGALVIAQWGIRAAFGLSVVASVAALVLVLRVPDLGADARAASRDDPATLWAVLGAHRHTLATIGLGATAISALRAIRLSVVPLWADHLGLPAAQVSLLFAIGSAVEILLFYPAGWVMDRFGRSRVAVPTALALACGLIVMPFSRDFVDLLLVALIMAVGNGLGSGIVMTLGADTAPVLHRAKYLGGWRLCGDLGATGGPLLLSALAATAALGLASLTLGLGGLAASAWVALWVGRLDRTRRP